MSDKENVVPFAAGINKIADKLQEQAVEEIQMLLETAQLQLDDLEETAAGLFTSGGSLKIMSVFDRVGLEGYTDIDETPFRIAVHDLLEESRNLVDQMLDVVQEYKENGNNTDFDGDTDDGDDTSPDNDVEPDGGNEDEPDDDEQEPDPDGETPNGPQGNKGHGNNTDGVDNDNPGRGSGGPNDSKTGGSDTTEGDIGNQGDSTPGASQAVLDQVVNPPQGDM